MLSTHGIDLLFKKIANSFRKEMRNNAFIQGLLSKNGNSKTHFNVQLSRLLFGKSSSLSD